MTSLIFRRGRIAAAGEQGRSSMFGSESCATKTKQLQQDVKRQPRLNPNAAPPLVGSWNRHVIRPLGGMQIKKQLIAELTQVEAGIDAQKRSIKHNITKGLAIDDAEQHLRQLRTRKDVLETNLRKCDPQPEGDLPGARRRRAAP
jgi:hypothetical protein